LKRAAKEIVARHAGDFPRQYEEALALPGIGHYTAAAVLSIAYEAPHAVLDGNVARVLARLGAVRGDLRLPARWRKLQATAQDLLARKAPGDWNQSMMELGATVCTPKSPRCGECPVEKWCQARRRGIAGELPHGRKKRASIELTLAAAVLLDPRGRTLLVRQSDSDGALFSRMWQFPAVEARGKEAATVLGAHLRKGFSTAPDTTLTPLATARHTVTFRNVRLKPYLVRVAQFPRAAGTRIVALGKIRRLPISNATRKIADVVIAHVAQ
jgi:A/G-specific adenine glycosylase